MSVSINASMNDAIALVKAIEDSIINCDEGRLIWADTLPARVLTALQRFPQPLTAPTSNGKTERVSLAHQVVSACGDELNSFMDQLSAKGQLTEDLEVRFVSALVYLCLMPQENCNEYVINKIRLKLWELRNLLALAAEQSTTATSAKPERSTASEEEKHEGERLLNVTDIDAAPYRDGATWCTGRYALERYGIQRNFLTKAWKEAAGYCDVKIEAPRDADTGTKERQVFLRIDLKSLSNGIERFRDGKGQE